MNEYQKALEAAGATVHAFESFGSYQGDWFAKVTFKGVSGWAHGSYGSCSGCDSFQAEFGNLDTNCDVHRWDGITEETKECQDCAACSRKFQERTAAFGLTYLDPLLTQQQAEAVAKQKAEWSLEDKEALDWLKKHSWYNDTTCT